MASDGKEEREFYIKLRNEILNIGALRGWIDPKSVLAEDTLEDALEGDKGKFRHVHISITDFVPIDDAHAFGAVGGQITFLCAINVIVRNNERVTGPLPANLVGISSGPSLSIIGGALCNAFHDSTLGGWCFVTELGPGRSIKSAEMPDRGCVGRSYSFSAVKEVER